MLRHAGTQSLRPLQADKLTENQSKEIEGNIAEIRTGVDALQSKGLPLGHVFYSYCSNSTEADSYCEDYSFLKTVRWLLLTILAGILIGLGGPFWFRVFSGLSQVFQVLRGFGVESKPEEAKPEELVALPSAEDSAKPKDVLDSFTVAAASSSGQTALLARAPEAGRRFID